MTTPPVRARSAEVKAGSARERAAKQGRRAVLDRGAIGNGWRTLCAAALLACLALPARAQEAGLENDYPTTARVDYVFGCMAANGNTRAAMEKCSCSVDTLATILPYDKYVAASTVLSMLQGAGGQRQNTFRSTKVLNDKVADLRRAQAEAEIRCYRGGA